MRKKKGKLNDKGNVIMSNEKRGSEEEGQKGKTRRV